MTQPVGVAHDTWRQNRADGSILLGSNVPMGPIARTTGEWVHRWAAETPDRVFVAERSGAGWRALTYGELLQQVRPGRGGLGGPRVECRHAHRRAVRARCGPRPCWPWRRSMPAFRWCRWPSSIPWCRPPIPAWSNAIQTVRPHLVFADRAGPYAAALQLECMAGAELVCSDTEGAGVPVTPFAALLRGAAGVDLDAVHAATGPDTVAKILFTSGSTSNPKGVLTTQRMMCVNQAQMLAAMPLLRQRAHRILDWLPWNHVFGGSHNFNLMLANGGSLYIDHGKPTRAGVADTIRNIHDHAGTLAFNVPVGFSLLVAAMRSDAALRRAYFAELELIFLRRRRRHTPRQ